MRFSFTNGQYVERTEIFGIKRPVGLTKTTKRIPSTVSLTGTVSEYLRNPYPIDLVAKSYFGIYNFGVNLVYNVGMDDSAVFGPMRL